MEPINQTSFNALIDKVKKLEADLVKSNDLLKSIKGVPVIQGYSGKKFDLNDNLNVILLLKRISDLETSVTSIQNGECFDLSTYLNNITSVPMSSATTGLKNQVAYDSNYLYVCRQDNHWERIAWDTLWNAVDVILDEAGDDFLAEDDDPLEAE